MPSSTRLTSLGLSTRNCTSTSAPKRVVPFSLRPVTSTLGDSMWASVLTAQPARRSRTIARSERFMGFTLPLHAQLQLHVPLLVPIEEEPLAPAVEIEVAQDLDVPPAILLHEVEPPLAHPFERLEAVRGLAHAQRLLGEMPHAHPEAEARRHVLQQVEGGEQAREVLARVAGEDVIVETLDVVADHQRGAAQGVDQGAYLALAIHLETPLLQEAEHADGAPHAMGLVPAAHVGGGAEGLEVEEDGVPFPLQDPPPYPSPDPG